VDELEAGFSIGLVLGWTLAHQIGWGWITAFKIMLAIMTSVFLETLSAGCGVPAGWGLAMGGIAHTMFLSAIRQRSMQHG
jgi:hypothetical protein